MKEALKNLKHFVGTAVTIITTPINRDFSELQKCDYFVGIVESVDEMGIMTQHPVTGCKNYYFYNSICAISEEQVLHPEDPEDAKLIEELEEKRRTKTSPPIPEVVTPPGSLVDVDFLNKMR